MYKRQLECRDPFLDHRIAEFAFSLPMDFLYKNGEHKHILKHILRKWISEAILQTPKKGFVVPLYEWMKGPFRPLVMDYLSKEEIRSVGVLDDKIVSKEVERFYRYNGIAVSYTHLRAHETLMNLVCRLLLEKTRDVIGLWW